MPMVPWWMLLGREEGWWSSEDMRSAPSHPSHQLGRGLSHYILGLTGWGGGDFKGGGGDLRTQRS